MDPYEQFTEVYSISDLHLTVGDNVDEQALAALAETVTTLAARASCQEGQRTALVVNGDIVDFLDIEPQQYFDPFGAPGKLQEVFKANAPFWNALEEFAEVGTVVLTLGNHDVELALPTCQALLRQRIRGSLVLAFDGAGYRCRVGRATAFFVHGNNEDPWNFIDYDLLGRIAADVNAGIRPYEAWEPNEGTRLVIEVLNKQKLHHPFIDLVKPEKPWLGELIAKLGFGGLVGQVREYGPRFARARVRYGIHRRSRQAAYLGKGASPGGAAPFLDGDQLLLQADHRYRSGERVVGSGAMEAATLGAVRDLPGRRRAPEAEIRKHILDSLVGDTTFVLQQSDEIYDSLGPKLGPAINWVVCGHTHLRRSYEDRPDRTYFNTGTWMRLIDLYDASAAEGQFEQVLKALDARTRAELDQVTWLRDGSPHSLVLRQPTVAILRGDQEGETGWLIDAAGPSAAMSFAPLAGSLRRVMP